MCAEELGVGAVASLAVVVAGDEGPGLPADGGLEVDGDEEVAGPLVLRQRLGEAGRHVDGGEEERPDHQTEASRRLGLEPYVITGSRLWAENFWTRIVRAQTDPTQTIIMLQSNQASPFYMTNQFHPVKLNPKQKPNRDNRFRPKPFPGLGARERETRGPHPGVRSCLRMAGGTCSTVRFVGRNSAVSAVGYARRSSTKSSLAEAVRGVVLGKGSTTIGTTSFVVTTKLF